MRDSATHPSLTFAEREYPLDKYGFLESADLWDENFAQGMATLLGIFGGLTEEHWQFIHYLRKKFEEEQSVPLVVFALADNKMKLSRFRALFPTGYQRGACKLAGINFSFMSSHNILLTYENYVTLRTEHHLTADGFLAEFDAWNKGFAELIASEWRLASGLTDTHWKVVRYLRDYYLIHKTIPAVFETCKANELALADLHTYFPDGYRRGACRMAGLPFLA